MYGDVRTGRLYVFGVVHIRTHLRKPDVPVPCRSQCQCPPALQHTHSPCLLLTLDLRRIARIAARASPPCRAAVGCPRACSVHHWPALRGLSGLSGLQRAAQSRRPLRLAICCSVYATIPPFIALFPPQWPPDGPQRAGPSLKGTAHAPSASPILAPDLPTTAHNAISRAPVREAVRSHQRLPPPRLVLPSG